MVRLLEEVSTAPLPDSLSQSLLELMQKSEFFYTGVFALRKMVFKCGVNIIVKAVRNLNDYTEYTILQYLQRYKPNIPAPRPLGLVRMNNISLIFVSYIPTTTLGEVWEKLDSDQKASIRDQLDEIFIELRSTPYSDGQPFGGIGGEGCKYIRRHLRRSEKPITSIGDFEDFLFSAPHPGGNVLIEMLYELSPKPASPPQIVFTHGDLRPDNIAVDMVDGNRYIISGLLDWEYGGFYPEYWEAVRSTNCIAPCESNDWYLFLPDCLSPKRYAHW